MEEEAELSSFYAPGGGFEFFTDGHSPVSLEILSGGHYVGAGGLFSQELITQVPLVASVPGAPYASVKSIIVKVGSAFKSHGKTIYYGRLPKNLPERRLPAEDRNDLRRKRRRIETGDGDSRIQSPMPTQVAGGEGLPG